MTIVAKSGTTWIVIAALVAIIAGATPGQIHASVCQPEVGQFLALEGVVEVQSRNGAMWSAANLTGRLCQGDTVRVGEASRAAIALINEAVLRVDQNTSIRLTDVVAQQEEQSLLEVVMGAIHSFSRKPRRVAVNTPYVNGSIEGTEFYVRVNESHSDFSVFEGVVVAQNRAGEVRLNAGESARTQPGKAPFMRQLVSPRDQVQWGLYFPSLASSFKESTLNEAAQGLLAGRAEKALRTVNQHLAKQGDDPDALALRSIIRLVTAKEGALVDAAKAYDLSKSGAVSIAYSYALQSVSEVARARSIMAEASTRHATDAHVLARLAELELMVGNARAAEVAALQAAQISPNNPKARSVLGFAQLATGAYAGASKTFEIAVELESDDPMAHLGLGLAAIGAGDLLSGRQRIEGAVALDSNSSILRSYLGKAYYEEHRSGLALDQYGIAQQLDSNDPTSFLYRGVQKQTENRPIEAIADLQASVALNDNRAVYRSRNLLDKDRSARGISLARAYQDVGFNALARRNAVQSLASDPSNAAAHRFLSDSFAGDSRSEAARVSEFQQSLMFADSNIAPIFPSQASTNLSSLSPSGPTATGYNEFTPLFQRNQHHLVLSGNGGSNETYQGEAVLFGNQAKWSYSLGAYRDDGDGYRANNDIQNEAYVAFVQFAATEQLNLQLEYNHRDTEHGDLGQNFDLSSYGPDARREFEKDSLRIGARWKVNRTAQLLFSATRADREEFISDSDGFVIPGIVQIDIDTLGDTDAESDQYELQYLLDQEVYDLILGGSDARVEQSTTVAINTTIQDAFLPFPLFDNVLITEAPTEDVQRAYAYLGINAPGQVRITLGASRTDYELDDLFDIDETQAKLGIEWDVTPSVRLRAAWFELTKPALAANRTLEPTHVAGFNQVTDDPNGTTSEVTGIGADFDFGGGLYAGVEWTDRKIDALAVDLNTGLGRFDDHEETVTRGYVSWAMSDRWALSVQVIKDEFAIDEGELTQDAPQSLETLTIPLQLSYFHPGGFFASVTASSVDQAVKRPDDPFLGVSLLPEGNESFEVIDLTLGYRLPARRGSIALIVKNLLDEDFRYLDNTFRSFRDEPVIAPYVPETTAVLQARLLF